MIGLIEIPAENKYLAKIYRRIGVCYSFSSWRFIEHVKWNANCFLISKEITNVASKIDYNMTLSIFVFYSQAGDFLTSLLRLATSHDSHHPEKNIYLFITSTSFIKIYFFNPVPALQIFTLGKSFIWCTKKVYLLWLSTLYVTTLWRFFYKSFTVNPSVHGVVPL